MSDKAIYLDMDTFDDMLKAKQGTELRDQFAMAALQGMGLNYEKVGPGFSEAYAKGAYELADAMLEARK